MIFQCPDCGTRIEGEASSCPVCGRPFARPQQTKAQSWQEEPVTRPDAKPQPRQSRPLPSFSPESIPRRPTQKKPPPFRWWYIPILIGAYLFGFLCGGLTVSIPTAPAASGDSSTSLSAPAPTARIVSAQPFGTSSTAESSSSSSQAQAPESSHVESAVSSQSAPEESQSTSLYEITYQHCEVFRDNSGNLICNSIIEISNTTQKSLYLRSARLDFEDTNGTLIGTCDNLSRGPEIIRPGGIGYFFCNSGSVEGNFDPASEYTSVPDIKVEKSANPVVRYETSDLSISKDENFSFATVIGRMTNSTDKSGGLICGTCVLLGEDNTPLGVYETWFDSLPSGESTSFEMPLYGLASVNYADIKTYWVCIEKVQYQ